MIARWKLLAGGALALAPVPAAAQLAAPVATGQQQGDPLARRAGAAQVAVPPAEAAPYQPTVIEPPVTDSRGGATEHAQEAPPRQVPQTRPSEFESFVSAAASTPLRRFGADLLVPGARDFTAGARPRPPAGSRDIAAKPGAR